LLLAESITLSNYHPPNQRLKPLKPQQTHNTAGQSDQQKQNWLFYHAKKYGNFSTIGIMGLLRNAQL